MHDFCSAQSAFSTCSRGLEPSLQKHYCQLESLPFLTSGEEQSQIINMESN